MTMGIRETENLIKPVRPVQVILRTSGQTLKQPTYDWKTADKYQELQNFEIEIKNIFMTNSYSAQDSKMSLSY